MVHRARSGPHPPALRPFTLAVALISIGALGCQDDGPVPTALDTEVAKDIAIGGVDPLLPTTIDSDGDGLSDTEEETLLRQYRPSFFFDGQEFIFPISVSQWGLAKGRLGGRFYTNLSSLQSAVYASPSGTMEPTNLFIVGDREGRAPVYVDATKMPSSFGVDGKTNLVWLHYYLLFGEDAKLILTPFNLRHRGDWEHICVLVERNSAGDRYRRPVRLHYHHHGDLDVASSAYAYHSDSWGRYHPRVYVEAGAHGMYRNPGQGPVGPHNSGNGSPENSLENPMRFMTDHWSSRRGVEAGEKDVLRRFRGKWGDTPGSPRGPLQFNGSCDHDYVARPSFWSFRLSDC